MSGENMQFQSCRQQLYWHEVLSQYNLLKYGTTSNCTFILTQGQDRNDTISALEWKRKRRQGISDDSLQTTAVKAK
jgi:hypothetical protein